MNRHAKSRVSDSISLAAPAVGIPFQIGARTLWRTKNLHRIAFAARFEPLAIRLFCLTGLLST